MDSRFRPQSQEQGGVVQKTPGEFDHDTNDMILMAPTADGLVDTGIRQTGGEFVLNPEQAEGLEDAYDAVDPRNPTFDQLLALYEAARFWRSHSLTTITQHNNGTKILRPSEA